MATAEAETGITWAQLTLALQQLAIERGHYHGYPTPVDGLRMELAAGFPYPGYAEIGMPDATFVCTNRDVDETAGIRNYWFSKRLRRGVWIYMEQGRIRHLIEPKADYAIRFEQLFNTLRAGLAWRVDAEIRAQQKLRDLVGEDRFGRYLCTGAIMERSRRSSLVYVFRRLLPTIVLRSTDESVRVLACLCLHPLGYYTGTHAGCMVPTDDLIAHLLLMRADEHMLWRRCNQHPAWLPQAGI